MSVVVVMGVSGCGKSTVGGLLAERLGWPFEDADLLHPPANVAKMRSGVPLTDADRWPWLERVAGWIAERADREREERAPASPAVANKGVTVGGVVACSALKRRYRDLLRRSDPDLRLVFLDGPRDILIQRLEHRDGHFFPKDLLDSQLADLEEPTMDEHPIVVQIGQSPDEAVNAIIKAIE